MAIPWFGVNSINLRRYKVTKGMAQYTKAFCLQDVLFQMNTQYLVQQVQPYPMRFALLGAVQTPASRWKGILKGREVASRRSQAGLSQLFPGAPGHRRVCPLELGLNVFSCLLQDASSFTPSSSTCPFVLRIEALLHRH